MAVDLRAFLAESLSGLEKSSAATTQTFISEMSGPSKSAPATDLQLQTGATIRITPKGLRSFDAADSDFFLDLLPGPHGRDGLPESIRFWKSRIETRNPDEGFQVGMIYGPSGCGKSSLVKAGILPRIHASVTVIYLEATSDKTEFTLLKLLRRRLPELSQTLSLSDSLNAIRQGKVQRGDEKVLLGLINLSNGCTPTEKILIQSWCRRCVNVTAHICRRSLWCAMISGWRPRALCVSWKFHCWREQTPRWWIYFHCATRSGC